MGHHQRRWLEMYIHRRYKHTYIQKHTTTHSEHTHTYKQIHIDIQRMTWSYEEKRMMRKQIVWMRWNSIFYSSGRLTLDLWRDPRTLHYNGHILHGIEFWDLFGIKKKLVKFCYWPWWTRGSDTCSWRPGCRMTRWGCWCSASTGPHQFLRPFSLCKNSCNWINEWENYW